LRLALQRALQADFLTHSRLPLWAELEVYVRAPEDGPKVRGVGGSFNPLDILGIMSGRIRTDSLLNFGSDLVGIASPDDIAREKEKKRLEIQRKLFRDCPPGSQCI
jgi:hypothetical protein